MTAHVLENLGPRPRIARSLRLLLTRLGRAIDALVSAKAARAVPEWQMRKVQGAIKRHLGHVRAAEMRGRTTQASDAAGGVLPESAISNFSR